MKILVANRGEIALRVIRALRELNVKSVAVYSASDRESPHVRLADEAWCIGSGAAADSYLRGDRILTAAKASGATAIHPGYGFLSENDRFAQECESAGVVFIGPKGAALSRLADKALTKKMAASVGVPVIPGSAGGLKSADEAKSLAVELGFPILLKAAFGGGGRGIYRVDDVAGLTRAWDLAQRESKSATGKSDLYLEKLLEDSRHVEIQVACDLKGKTQSFIERDCTIQRRNQKLIEETPSPFLDGATRVKMMAAAMKAVQACSLTALATVEFLLLPDRKTFYFMEINKRIQVEHPVTEELLGIDLVSLQIHLALGESLPAFDCKDFGTRHALEVRINAEDFDNNFLPTEGAVNSVIFPGGPGIRVDSFLAPGVVVGTNYDSLIAKIISSSSEGRGSVLARMKRALYELEIDGLTTNAPFYLKFLNDPKFASSKEWYSTGYLNQWLKTVPLN